MSTGSDEILKRTVAIKVLRSEFSHNGTIHTSFRTRSPCGDKSEPSEYRGDLRCRRRGRLILHRHGTCRWNDVETVFTEEYISVEKRCALSVRFVTQSIMRMQPNHSRDIKPQNMMIDQTGNVKVTDFGIAVAMSNATLTHTMSVLWVGPLLLA